MKKLLLFSTLLLIAGGAFAQLTVKRTSAGAESYIYVNDQILFVEKDVNLSANPNLATEPSIYLRNNGQLIQGMTNSNNKGSGSISVQQNAPKTNARAYYYWCSPIGNPTLSGGTPGNKNFGIGSVYDGYGTRSANQVLRTTDRDGLKTIPTITVSTRWLYTYPSTGTELENKYIRMNADNNAPAGKGFTMKGVGPLPSIDQKYDFRGRPNNGDFPIIVAGPVNGVSQMTLSGNPYPSALDLNQLFYDSGNHELGAFWYYDEDRDEFSHYYSDKSFGYGTWVPEGEDSVDFYDNEPAGHYTAAPFDIYTSTGGGTGTGTGSGGQYPHKRYAPIGQGIMFVGVSDGEVTIKNSHRIFVKEGEPGSVFQRPTENISGDQATTQNDLNGDHTLSSNPNIDTRTPQLRLYVIFDEALTRDMLLLFSDETSDGYDRGFDGLSPGGMKSDAFFPIGDDSERLPYVIQGTNYDINKKIPITFKLHKTSQVEVRAIEEVRKPYQRVYLFDKLENTYRPLHSENVNASSTLPAGVYEERFYIVFRNLEIKSDIPEEELLAKEAVKNGLNFFQNNPAKQMEVSNPHGYTLKSATVYDMAGKLVISEKNLGDNTKYTFYTGNLSDGVYLIKLTTSEDFIIDYKAIVHNK